MSPMLIVMARFGRQHRDLERRESKAQVAAVTSAFFEKPTSGCVERRQDVELEDPDFRYSQRLVVHEDKLVEYALVLTRRQQDRWVEVYSVDTRHGVLHEHVSGHQRENDRRDVQPLYTQVDVQESFDTADQLVLGIYRRMRS